MSGRGYESWEFEGMNNDEINEKMNRDIRYDILSQEASLRAHKISESNRMNRDYNFFDMRDIKRHFQSFIINEGNKGKIKSPNYRGYTDIRVIAIRKTRELYLECLNSGLTLSIRDWHNSLPNNLGKSHNMMFGDIEDSLIDNLLKNPRSTSFAVWEKDGRRNLHSILLGRIKPKSISYEDVISSAPEDCNVFTVRDNVVIKGHVGEPSNEFDGKYYSFSYEGVDESKLDCRYKIVHIGGLKGCIDRVNERKDIALEKEKEDEEKRLLALKEERRQEVYFDVRMLSGFIFFTVILILLLLNE